MACILHNISDSSVNIDFGGDHCGGVAIVLVVQE
jgi:hypothetical protein